MNWDAIGAVAELFGAIGVIASLLYLARQMRNGAADARRAAAEGRRGAAQAVLTKLNAVYASFANDNQLADVWVRGSANLSVLSPEEAMQFSGLLFSAIRPYEELLYYKRAGEVDDWVWESVELVILPMLTTPGGLEWWAKRGSWSTRPFQDHIASALPSASVERLRALEQSLEGEDFRAGVLVEAKRPERVATEAP